jgi:hypothetical protein
MGFDRALPAELKALHELPFDYDNGIDFEPYSEFQSADENASWIKAWTGNKDLTAAEYRIFGQDGTGGYAAFWLIKPSVGLLEQPIVFFGSEGELGVIAVNFADYLWLLAANVGPYEAVAYGAEAEDRGPRNAAFEAFADTYAAADKKSATAVLANAKAKYPDFDNTIRALCG